MLAELDNKFFVKASPYLRTGVSYVLHMILRIDLFIHGCRVDPAQQ